jgi:hypothetical protein
MEGTIDVISSAISTSLRVGAPKDKEPPTASFTAQYHGAPGVNQFNVTVSVFIIEIGAFGRFNKYRVSTYGFKCSYG